MHAKVLGRGRTASLPSVLRRAAAPANYTLTGRRVALRPLDTTDFAAWQEVRLHNRDWLEPWEPKPERGFADPIRDSQAFRDRCSTLSRQRQLDGTHQFGIFVDDGVFAGEISLQGIQRGASQHASLGYWVDRRHAGRGYVPEACVLMLRYAFEDLRLHRVEIAIVPRNDRSRRVPEKLGLREEGIAKGFLQINGVWEDHVRYAITIEEWMVRRAELLTSWVGH
jgi:ribosomal-protein-alanine N-acetyltransferase